MYGICNLSIVPCRQEPANRSEMVSQLLFGDAFTILEEQEEWIKIRTAADNYESWISNKQYAPVRERTFEELQNLPRYYCNELIGIIQDMRNQQAFPIVMGSVLPFLNNKDLYIENQSYRFEGQAQLSDQKNNTEQLMQTACLFLNAPYLWGGRSALGIDCSGFMQLVYKMNGYALPRDAWQQAELGEPLSFVEEAEAGDLAFFDNEEGRIIHVGMVMNDQQIIHASGRVRIDRFDHYGIFHSERKKYSHMLRVIKRII